MVVPPVWPGAVRFSEVPDTAEEVGGIAGFCLASWAHTLEASADELASDERLFVDHE